MRQKSSFFSITLFVLVLTASVHSQPRLIDNTNSNLDGSTITITPSSTYKVYCYTSDIIQKNWYKINGGSASHIAKDPASVPDHGYAIRSSDSLALHFDSFRTNDIGEYQCGYTSVGQSSAFTTLTIYLTTPTPTPTPTPMPPSKVQGVTVSKTVQGSSPTLSVSWSAVNGSGINYTVCYSTTRGTPSDPPSGANCGTSEITGTSTTLGTLSIGTTYYIWVAAVSSDGRGPYSDRQQERTYRAPSQVGPPVLTKAASSGRPALRVTWTEPSSDRTITKYQLQYGIKGTRWSTKDVTSRSITLEGLSAGTIYDIQVRAVSDVGAGQYSQTSTETTYRAPSQFTIGVITPSTTTLTVRWDDEGFSYRLHVQKKGSTEINTFGPVTLSYNITGLESNTEYTVVIEAHNPLGSANKSVVRYTLPEVPGDLALEVLSSTSIRVTWTPPPNAERLPLTYHVGYSSEFTAEGSTPTTNLSLVLTGLHPFDVYTVTVEAANTGGRGGPTMMEAQTFSDVPSVAPSSPITVEERSRSALLQWSIPPRSGRNGIITQYRVDLSKQPGYRNVRNITVLVVDPSFDEPLIITHNVTDLTPFTKYYFRVAAINDAGVGPFNRPYKDFTTEPDFPGPVSNLSYQITSDTSAKIMWSEPEEPNGVITGYDVAFGDYGDYRGHTMESTLNTMKELMDLSPETPINVTVQAKHKVGLGKPNSITLFTKEGVPRVAPKNVTVVRINSTAISVSLNPLTLQEARGWPVYRVFWESISQRTTRAAMSVTTSDSSVIIGNLDPASYYSIVVQVSTGAGTSEELRSQPVILVNVMEKNGLDSDASNDGLSAGLFVAGLFSGVIAVLLVEGIIFGAWKISKMSQKKNTKGPYTEPTNIQMTECPAYETIDREVKGTERLYEEIESRDTKGN